MTSTINASTTGAGGVITTADNSGSLALQGAGVTGVTINSSGAIGLGTSPAYGTAGQPLLSGGSLAQATFGTLGISAGGTGQTNQHDAFNALAPVTAAGDLIVGDGTNSSIRLPIGTNGQILTSNGTTAVWTTPAATGVTSFSAGSTGLTPASATTGAITLGGTLAVANGGTGVTSSSGANSVVLRDINSNVTANAFFAGFTTTAASGTTITLTASSTPVYVITGSGGQVIQLPNATTLPNGAIFSFNNNQSSGAITVNNNSSTLIASVPAGGYTTIVLLSNSTAAGSWDRHDQSPSNVSWSTNTFSYPGSITSATWNGSAIGATYGGTAQTSYTTGDILYASATNTLSKLAIGSTGQVLTISSGVPAWATPASAPAGAQIYTANNFGGL